MDIRLNERGEYEVRRHRLHVDPMATFATHDEAATFAERVTQDSVRLWADIGGALDASRDVPRARVLDYDD